MPNWAEGNIRLRGKRENILDFLRSELIAVDENYATIRTLSIEENQGGWSVILKKPPNTCDDLYFRGSDRQFIMNCDDEMELIFSEGRNQNLDQVVIIDDFQGAWGVDDGIFQRYAMKHHIDIRIFVWEKGMCWSSAKTFYKDGRIESSTIQYADWLWDSPLPNYGG